MTSPSTDHRAARVIDFFEQLTPEDAAGLARIYAADAYFRDPFNEVRGLSAIARIFDDMFARLADCRFVIREVVADEGGMMLTWDFTFRIRRYRSATVQTIHGASHLKFDADGRIAYHRDYWDAAEELYAKLPLIGPVMRFLRQQLA